jgi:hypothetical protein
MTPYARVLIRWNYEKNSASFEIRLFRGYLRSQSVRHMEFANASISCADLSDVDPRVTDERGNDDLCAMMPILQADFGTRIPISVRDLSYHL